MKIIFLDIDGVLNTGRLLTIFGNTHICSDRVALLKRIVDATGASIVLSSTWRRTEERRQMVFDALAVHGLSFFNCTPVARKMSLYLYRRQEIAMWLEEFPQVTKFAIIDDDECACIKGNESSYFRTEPDNDGLTLEIANRVIEHLNS
jgi:hypothetical protein